MSNEEPKKKEYRYVAKFKASQTKYGPMYQIMSDNFNALNKDGTPNKYFKGALIYVDAETGNQYLVKQMGLYLPKEGMHESHAKNGYTHFVTLNLDDEYQVTPLK